MRIVQLTPGTGNFHCGSCLRDEALVHALRRLGHEVIMTPLYLPLVLDEPQTDPTRGVGQVFFGGVNVYLQQKMALFRRTPRWLDQLWDSRPLLRAAASRTGMTRPHELGELMLSMLRGDQGRQLKELDRLIAFLRTQPPPDVIALSNVLLTGFAKPLRDALGAPVVCTLQGEDSFLDALDEPWRSEAWALLGRCVRHVDAFVAVSRYYAGVMRNRLGLDPDKVYAIPNGVNLEGLHPAEHPPQPPNLGYLARMIPGKGLQTLVEAFIILKQRDRIPGPRLAIAGAMIPADRRFVKLLRKQLHQAGVAHHVVWRPNLTRDEKLSFLRSLTVMSVPATYGESFGLYVLEALACGVPVVQPRHAAFPELLAATGGGVLCEPDDPEALAAAIEDLLLDPAALARCARLGRDTVLKRFHVDRMASDVVDLYARVAAPEIDRAADPGPGAQHAV